MTYYDKIKEIQNLAWKNDDLMMQDDLFELQEKIADLALEIAQKEHKTDDLVKSFKGLYIQENSF